MKILVVEDDKDISTLITFHLKANGFETDTAVNGREAVEKLANEGFIPMPYMYPDLTVARDMKNAGAACIMPLGAPIGTNKGLITKDFIQI